MIDSKIQMKKYFLSIYVTWFFIIPSITTFLSGYMYAEDGVSIFQQIQWSRVPSYFALWGIIFPLTIVTAPAIYIAFIEYTGYTFFSAILAIGDPLATKMFFGTLLLIIAWVGPIVHLMINTRNHYYLVKEIEEKKMRAEAEMKASEEQEESDTETEEGTPTKEKEGPREITFLDYLAGFL